MKREKIEKRLGKAMKSGQICAVNVKFSEEDTVCRILPVAMSEEIILFIKDGDLAGNGYAFRRLADIEKVKIEDTPAEKKVLTADGQELPKVDMKNWQSVLADLEQAGNVVVVENEARSKKAGNYAIGKIIKLGHKCVGIKYYGPDPEWEGKKWKIPYEDITRITIESRYIGVLNQFVREDDNAEQEFSDMEEEK